MDKDEEQGYFDLLGVIIVITDKNGKISFINKKGCEILGYSKEEIIGKKWFNFLKPSKIKAHKNQRFLGRQIEDLTDFWGMEKLEIFPVVKRSLQKTFGFLCSEIEDFESFTNTENSTNFRVKEKKDEAWKIFKELIVGRDKPFENVENIILTRSGEKKIFSWRNTLLTDNKGNITGILGSGEDITQLKKLKKQIKFQASALSNISDAVIAVDHAYHVIYWNKGAEKLFNQKSEDVTGKLLSKIDQYEWINFKDENEPYKSLKSQGYWRGKDIHIKRNEESKWIDSSVSVLKYEDNDFAGIFTVIRDITEHKKIEEELIEASGNLELKVQRETELDIIIEELKRSNEELQQFAYFASHDLQEPLRTISSFTQLLETRYKGKLDGDADEYIGFVVEGTGRMQKLINDLLIYSRIATKDMEFEPIELEEVLNDTFANLNALIYENSALITHDPLPTVRGDSRQIAQLLQNLITNAIKFKKEGKPPKIHISAYLDEEKNEYIFSVADNGIGIDSKFVERIFAIFQRLHTRDEYPGTGIGLAICKKIIERHEGRIWVESSLGKGSTFYFTINSF